MEKLQQSYIFIPSKYKASLVLTAHRLRLSISLISVLCDSYMYTQDCYLVSILNELAGNSFMVFCGTCNNVQRTAILLRTLGLHAIPLHGKLPQVRSVVITVSLLPR